MAVALLTVAGADGAEGAGLPVAFELELLTGSVTQPVAAKVAKAMINPRVACLIVFILEYLVTDVDRHDRPLTRAVLTFVYLAPGVLALGEDDAAGEGLAAGLGLFAGALAVAPGEGDVDAVGLAAFGVFELLTGSVAQPAANAIEAIARRRSVVRLIMLMFGVLISFCLVRARLKSRMMIAQSSIGSNGRSHRRFVGDLRSVCTETLVFEKVLARLADANQAARTGFDRSHTSYRTYRTLPAFIGIAPTFSAAGRG